MRKILTGAKLLLMSIYNAFEVRTSRLQNMFTHSQRASY